MQMRLTLRLSVALISSVAAVSLLIAYLQTRADTRDAVSDLDRHGLVLADSLTKSAEQLVSAHSYRDLQRLVDRFADREHIAGIAVYGGAGEILATTTGLLSELGRQPDNMKQLLLSGNGKQESFLSPTGSMHLTALPLRGNGAVIGALALYYDATYIDRQAAALWRRALTGVLVQTLLIGAVTLIAIRWGVGRPLQRMAARLRELRMGGSQLGSHVLSGPPEFEPLTREVTRLATSLTAARAVAEEEARLRDTAEALWTAERLRIFVQGRLSGSRLFAVSNREPYEHFFRSGGVQVQVPASGLVTALEPILRACDGTWIAQATGDADREAVDENDRVRVPPDNPQYTLRRLWLTKEEDHGFYLGFANEGLWPLCHIAHTRPTFRAEDWEFYEEVNRKFAATLLEEIEGEENPVVLVQDYHFALLPRMIKERRPDARVAIFWHIPWPNPEAFGICPWQRQLLDGLLGADLIGFHLQQHCNNFLETTDRVLESRIDWEQFAVNRNGQHTLIRPFPISVAFEPSHSHHTAEMETPYLKRAALLEKLGVRASFMGVGVDRVDYTKGITERFRAVERFLEKYPSYRKEFTFVQIGSPSRTSIKRYQDLTNELMMEADRINRRYQTPDWKPIVFLNRQHSHAEILPYYQTADLCLVSSLHDGMNLVAKEFVAAREDEHGVLILSRFAGAAHELADALVVNPYDTEEMAEAIARALTMPPQELRIRMQRMRATVHERNIYRWAGTLMEELCRIRVGPTLEEFPLTRSASFRG
jgi:alpha,alpha-trehalose-phosphate synthase [UDP-forming]